MKTIIQRLIPTQEKRSSLKDVKPDVFTSKELCHICRCEMTITINKQGGRSIRCGCTVDYDFRMTSSGMTCPVCKEVIMKCTRNGHVTPLCACDDYDSILHPVPTPPPPPLPKSKAYRVGDCHSCKTDILFFIAPKDEWGSWAQCNCSVNQASYDFMTNKSKCMKCGSAVLMVSSELIGITSVCGCDAIDYDESYAGGYA